MSTTLRQFIQNKSTTSQDVTVGLIFSVAGTDGELYVLETDPLNPVLPTAVTFSYPEGLSTVNTAINNNGSINITTGSYVQLIASTSGESKQVEIMETGGRWYYLATGAAGFEVNRAIIPPGGNGVINLKINSATRVSVIAIDGTASSGYLGVNLYG
jgi:hypothetical protein